MGQETSESAAPELLAWDFQRFLQRVNTAQAQLSRGFLRCRPEKWFPSLSAEWLPLAHSLSVEFKVHEVKPVLNLPEGLDVGYTAVVDDEPLGIFFDREAIRVAVDVIVPGSIPDARDLVLEYLARRFVSTLSATWSGQNISKVQFDNRIDPFGVEYLGVVKLSLLINGSQCNLWVGLGSQLVDILDGLWRRQIQSTQTRAPEGVIDVFLEIAQLAVPPAELVAYTKTGTVIDLEVPAVDAITIRSSSKALFSAKMCNIDGRLGLEALPTPPVNQILPDGMTRISISFAKLSQEASSVAEFGQVGTIWDSGIALSDNVQMILNGDVVAQGVLCTYDGRFALSVL